jgi:hypothetical protein
MQLRDHPLMRYGVLPNWPPVWSQPRGRTLPASEIGTLRYVWANPRLPTKFFLVIDHEGAKYVGCLVFDNAVFANPVRQLIQLSIGRTIKEIGDLDLAHTL